MYVQSWPKISAPLQFCQKMQHFSQKIVPIANVLVFTRLLFLFALQQHTKNREESILDQISHRTKKWTGQKYWQLFKIVRNNCFSKMWCSYNLYLDTPVASNRCGQYSNHTCNQFKWRKVDSTFVLCVTLSMEKRKKCKELSGDLREKQIVESHGQSQGYRSISRDLKGTLHFFWK